MIQKLDANTYLAHPDHPDLRVVFIQDGSKWNFQLERKTKEGWKRIHMRVGYSRFERALETATQLLSQAIQDKEIIDETAREAEYVSIWEKVNNIWLIVRGGYLYSIGVDTCRNMIRRNELSKKRKRIYRIFPEGYNPNTGKY